MDFIEQQWTVEKEKAPIFKGLRTSWDYVKQYNGGGAGTRTPDTGIMIPLLYQLSYTATSKIRGLKYCIAVFLSRQSIGRSKSQITKNKFKTFRPFDLEFRYYWGFGACYLMLIP
jgi:hypothetical protein